MKIIVFSSVALAKEAVKTKEQLVEIGHDAILPALVEGYAKIDSEQQRHEKLAKDKIEEDLIKKYFEQIKSSEAIIVLNYTRHQTENYLGGDSLIYMAFAHVLNKKIFLLNPIPKMVYEDEIKAMQPTILNGNLNNLK